MPAIAPSRTVQCADAAPAGPPEKATTTLVAAAALMRLAQRPILMVSESTAPPGCGSGSERAHPGRVQDSIGFEPKRIPRRA